MVTATEPAATAAVGPDFGRKIAIMKKRFAEYVYPLLFERPRAICSVAFDSGLSPRYAKKRRRPNILRCLDGLHLEPDASTLPRQGRADVLAVLPVHPQITLLNNSSEKRH